MHYLVILFHYHMIFVLQARGGGGGLQSRPPAGPGRQDSEGEGIQGRLWKVGQFPSLITYNKYFK